MVLQCINGVSSNPVDGRTKIWQLKDLILTLFGLIFRHIHIHCKHRLFPDYLYLPLIWLSFNLECSVGSYGYNCSQSCDGCLSNSCDKRQGVCTNTTGCKPGWQYVHSGLQKCDIGMLRKCSIIYEKGTTNV